MKNKLRGSLIMLLLVALGTMQAQEIETEFSHGNGYYYNMHNIVEAKDNTLLVQCPLFEAYNYSGSDIGSVIYKVSMEGTLLDSLLIPIDNVPLRTLFKAVTLDSIDCYLFGWFEKSFDDSTTYLKMLFVDDELNTVDTKEVALVNQLNDKIISSSDLFMDSNHDIIATYLLDRCIHVYRIGLDGMVKMRNRLPEIETYSSLLLQARHSGVYSETPLAYYFMVTKNNSAGNYYINVYFIDSTLQDAGHHQYYKFHGDIRHNYGMQEDLVTKDDSTYLLYSRAEGYVNHQNHRYTAVVEYDRGHNVRRYCLFEEDLYSSRGPIQAVVSSPDDIYYAYMTDTGQPNQLVLVCLDENLNDRWKRYFLNTGEFYWGTTMTALSDGRVAIGAYLYGYSPNRIAVVVFRDGSWDVNETPNSFHIRPYMFYPNPAQDQLHLQYSPDVQPAQIKLYDLQGRLVRTQGKAFETFDLGMLPAGTYTLRVTMEDGQVFADKVVKE